jgi:lysophospholipase L1-like esterase
MPFSSIVVALSPAVFYRCQEASGTTLTDTSGNSATGGVVGTVTFSQLALVNDGQTAKSIRAGTNPTKGYLTSPTTAPGTSNTAFTAGFFWQPTQTAIAYVAGSGDNTSTSGWNLAIDGTYIYLSVNQNGFSNTLYNARATYAAAGITVGVEQLWWVTYDGTGTWNVYLNGSSTPIMTATSAVLVTPTTRQQAFGGYANQTQSCGGYFSEIMLFSSVVSAANRQSVYSAAAIPASSNNLSLVGSTTGVTATWIASTGGTSPYNYQLYRGLVPSATFPASGQTLLYSGSALTYADTPPDSQLYYYNTVSTDSASTPVVTNGLPVSGQTTPKILIGCIGDSRTQGYNGTAGSVSSVTQLPAILQPILGKYVITASNQGIGGTTTATWLLSNTLSTALAAIVTASSSFVNGDKVFVQINLGVNDGQVAYRITASQYSTNLQAMIAAIKAYNIPHFAGIVLHYTFPPDIGVISAYDITCYQLVVQYNAVMQSLVDNVTVFLGDTSAVDYFGWNPSLMTDGLHPYTPGYGAWAAMWAKSYNSILNPSSGGGGATTYPASYAVTVLPGTNYSVDVSTSIQTGFGTVNVSRGTLITNYGVAKMLLASGVKLLPHP